jgi:ABC-type sugar transport system permease subunit
MPSGWVPSGIWSVMTVTWWLTVPALSTRAVFAHAASPSKAAVSAAAVNGLRKVRFMQVTLPPREVEDISAHTETPG